MSKTQLKVIQCETVSPSFVELLLKCKLHAGLSKISEAYKYVLGNPKAWLGTAYHAVLRAAKPGSGADGLKNCENVWQSETRALYDLANNHRLNFRFGEPEKWPGYHVMAAMAIVRAKEINESGMTAGGTSDNQSNNYTMAKEKWLSGSKGRIIGQPDLIRQPEIVDYKSGSIFEDDHERVVKEAYVRQLRLYAYLVFENFGWWPSRGRLLSMAGASAVVDIVSEDCEQEAHNALQLLDRFNNLVASRTSADQLGRPSAKTCKWCGYKLCCPAFWDAATEAWQPETGSDAVEAEIIEQSQSIHDGSAISLSLRVLRGTLPEGALLQLFPLDPNVHKDVSSLTVGKIVRVTGLWRRADESVIATAQTVITPEGQFPEII